MGQKGDVYEMVDGSRYVLVTPAAAVAGEYVEFEWQFPPGVFTPPPHAHPSQVEEYTVLEGALVVMVDGKWTTLGPGESASVPIGVNHTFRPPKEFTRVQNFHRPALGFEDFIADMQRIGAQKKLRGKRDPRLPMYLAAVWRRYPETLQATRLRERLGMPVAAAMARAFGKVS